VRVWGALRGGPVHLDNERFPGLAWCGAKKQFRHGPTREGGVHDVTCRKCVTAIRQDQPRAWRSR